MKSIPQQISLGSLHKLIGVPYKEKDCWEIVVDFYKEILGRDIIHLSYNKSQPRSMISKIIDEQRNKFIKVSAPELGDIILLNVYGVPSHVGIYLWENKMLHTTQKTDSVIEDLKRWENKILGFYRYDQG